jgi:hypothetical protein
VNPSLIASFKAPLGITPHVNVGMRFSEDTDKLEHQFFYIVGVEWQATSFLTLGLDFIGARIIDNKRPPLREQAGVGFAPLRPASDDIVDVGISFEVNAWKNVLVAGGVLIPLNKTGIRAQVIPSAVSGSRPPGNTILDVTHVRADLFEVPLPARQPDGAHWVR